MKDIFVLMKLDPEDIAFLDSVVTRSKQLTKEDVDTLINDQEVIELTANEIMQQVFGV